MYTFLLCSASTLSGFHEYAPKKNIIGLSVAEVHPRVTRTTRRVAHWSEALQGSRPRAGESIKQLFHAFSVVFTLSSSPSIFIPSFHIIFPSISCSWDVLHLVRCPRYCIFLILNCCIISLPATILINTSSLVVFAAQHIFNMLRHIHISKAFSLGYSDFVKQILHVSAP